MARLASAARMGYYPTPEELTPLIAAFLRRKENGLIRVFDPCAGEGAALRTIGEHLDAETYGVEIDQNRGKNAQRDLTRCVISDFASARISQRFASLLWLNPPYDWGARAGELERSERYERTFLRDTVKYLVPGGVLVYLIPLRRLDSTIARMLSYRFENVRVYRFPGSLFDRFKQIVVFGVCKKAPLHDDQAYRSLRDAGDAQAGVPFLPDMPDFVYDVPLSPDPKPFFFRSGEIDPVELEEEICHHGLYNNTHEILFPTTAAGRVRPIMPLRHGHLAQIIACGAVNGVVFDRERQNPLVVKGVTKKVVESRIEIEGDVERLIETDRIVVTIKALTRTGELITIE